MEVAAQLDATVVDMQFVKPLDAAMVLQLAQSHDWLVSIEENAVAGGAGSAVSDVLRSSCPSAQLLQLGLPDHWIEHGSRDEALSEAGLDVQGMLAAIEAQCL
jgi:1-deoxy-D-xylulose-5-phosphate synthase